ARIDETGRAELALSELLGVQAARTPDAPAVVCGGRALTWSELGARARALAERLAEHGAERQLVAVCVEPSPERVVALWAVLEAGAAWICLAPAGAPPPGVAVIVTS